jgi:hypothetical protein
MEQEQQQGDAADIVDTARAARFLGFGSKRTLERLRKGGNGPSYLHYSSRCIKYRISDLIRWRDAHRIDGLTHATALIPTQPTELSNEPGIR